MRLPVLPKAMAYILRPGVGGRRVLIFEHVGHPEVGLQVPAGTVDPGESPWEACLREVWEETGVAAEAGPVRAVGVFSYVHPAKRELHRRHVFVLDAPPALPETWTHTVTGEANDRGRRYACRWSEVRDAARSLAASQGVYLPLAMKAMRRGSRA